MVLEYGAREQMLAYNIRDTTDGWLKFKHTNIRGKGRCVQALSVNILHPTTKREMSQVQQNLYEKPQGIPR